MNKKSLRNYLIFLAVVFLLFFFIGRKQGDTETKLAVEVGMKQSDVEWLARMGEISEEELQELQDKSKGACTLKEYNKLLDDLLEGKKEQYFEKQANLSREIQSILSK